jgi:lipid-A-disaccharide synthase
MFIAGEPSGDEHASRVIARLSSVLPGVSCFGIGGPCMQKHGFEAVLPFAPFNRMGLSEVIYGLGFFIKAEKIITKIMAEKKPGLIVLVDYASFNIRIMKAATRLGIPVVWYIAPKVWVWKKKRAPVIGKAASVIACILPFEPNHFEGYRARALYVGNPSVEEIFEKNGFDMTVSMEKRAGTPRRIAIVPGSRPQEIKNILESMAEAGAILKRNHDVELRVSVYKGLDKNLFLPVLEKYGLAAFNGPLNELLAWADCAMVTSGTATLQAALMEVPHVLVYKTTKLNYFVFRHIIRFPFAGLPNIIAGKEIIKECLQKDADPQLLACCMSRLLSDPLYYQETRKALAEVRSVLGTKLPSREVSSIIAGYFK